MAGCDLSWKQFLEELESGEVSRETASRLLFHLAELCPTCREQAREFTHRTKRGQLQAAIQQNPAEVQALHERLVSYRREGKRDLRALLKMEPDQRRGRIHRALTRFRNPVLVDLLIEEALQAVRNEPFSALALAECAHDVALRVSSAEVGEAWAVTCIARANAHKGNALRAAGEFKAANPLIEYAIRVFDSSGTGDPLILGELISLLANLRRDQRQLEEAQDLFGKVAALYQNLGEEQALGRTLVSQSIVLRDMGEPKGALGAVEEAIAVLEAKQDAFLYLCALHNRAYYLADLARFGECRDALVENLPLYQAQPSAFAELRYDWLVGRVQAGLGEYGEAEATFIRVRQDFVSRGLSYDAALAGFDLALVYLEQRETKKLKQLATEMVPIFQAQDVERETVAALLLFQEAARAERVTRTMVEEMVRYLRAASQQRRCQRPS